MRKTILKLLVISFVFALSIAIAKPFVSEAAAVSAPKISSVKKSGDNGIKVTWKAVKGATGYRIYRKTANDSAYVKVATTSKLSYTDKKWVADAGTSINYIVKAYVKKDGKTSWSAKSKAKAYKVPASVVAEKPEDLLAGIWIADYEEYTFYKPGQTPRVNSQTDYAYWNINIDGYYAFSHKDGEKLVFKTYSDWSDTGRYMLELIGDELNMICNADPDDVWSISLRKVKCHFDENEHNYVWDE